MNELVDDTNFQIIITSAVRYAMGRMTYVPSSVCEWIMEHPYLVSTKTLHVILQDIEDAESRDDDKGDFCPFGSRAVDKPVWMELKEFANEELKKRKER